MNDFMNVRGHIHLDAVGGIAGDMFVAALLDARPDLHDRVFADLAAVIPGDAGQPTLRSGLSKGISVRRFRLDNPNHRYGEGDEGDEGEHTHRHEHERDEHKHDEHDQHDHGGSFAELVERIKAATLAPGTAEQAIAILRRLAEAESKMHRVPVEDVHFHEIADWDSLMDVVAAGSIVAALPGVSWSVSDLPVGGGLVRTQHGLLPVPAPATAELLRDFIWRDDGVEGERVTPTGAAILAHLIQPGVRAHKRGRLIGNGTGAGMRDLPKMPNILRAMIFEPGGALTEAEESQVIVLSFDVDYMSGEEIGVAAERLRDVPGVLDLNFGIRQGKKGRPVTAFRLLIVPDFLESVSRQCFVETSTIGMRWRSEQRFCLPRADGKLTLKNASGENVSLRSKRVVRPDGTLTLKLESDDLSHCSSLAERRALCCAAEREAGE